MKVNALVLLELIDDPTDEDLVNIVTTKVSVAVRLFHLNDALTDLEDRDIERTATKVEHGDSLVLLLV